MTQAAPNLSELRLRVAQIVPFTEAEGPGRRFALWFQGCPLRCPGCCNPEMLPFEGVCRGHRADLLRDFRQGHLPAAGEGQHLRVAAAGAAQGAALEPQREPPARSLGFGEGDELRDVQPVGRGGRHERHAFSPGE